MDYQGGPNVIRVLMKAGPKRFEDAILLALNIEEEASSQRMQVGS